MSNQYDDLVVSELYLSNSESCIDTCSTGVSMHVTVGEPSNESCDSHMTRQMLFGRGLNITRPLTDYKVLFIGTEGPVLTNFMLTLRNNEVGKSFLFLYDVHFFILCIFSSILMILVPKPPDARLCLLIRCWVDGIIWCKGLGRP